MFLEFPSTLGRFLYVKLGMYPDLYKGNQLTVTSSEGSEDAFTDPY